MFIFDHSAPVELLAIMNRIHHADKLVGGDEKSASNAGNSANPSSARLSLDVESGLFVAAEGQETSRVLFAPKHYEPNYAYPLLVWLHTPGSDERQLLRLMPTISLRNYVAVAPRGFVATRGGPSESGYVWPQTQEHIQEAEARILEAVEAAGRKFHVAPERVFLAGFDAGGTMALRVAVSRPRQFAGAISLCGAFPRGYRPLCRFADARLLPLFLAVGRDSLDYPPAQACDDLRLLHAAGMSIVLRQYPCGHELAEQMLRDVDRWIIEQITSAAELSGSTDG